MKSHRNIHGNIIYNNLLIQYGSDIAVSAFSVYNSAMTIAIMPIFGINQGATFPDLRVEHMKMISELDLPGYAIGGLAVGEKTEDIRKDLVRLDELVKIKEQEIIDIEDKEEYYQTKKAVYLPLR